MSIDKLELTPFSASDPQDDHPIKPARIPMPIRRGRKRVVYTSSMGAKIGLCLLVFAAAILIERTFVKANIASEPGSVVSAETENEGGGASGSGQQEDDVLGRLRFVEEENVTSVFAGQQKWSLPVPATAAELLSDDTFLLLHAAAEATVTTTASGEVRAVGVDETYGNYVRIYHGSDLESVYFHLENVNVEKGQPLNAMDAIGTLTDDGQLYIAIYQSGEKQDPSHYIDIAQFS